LSVFFSRNTSGHPKF